MASFGSYNCNTKCSVHLNNYVSDTWITLFFKAAETIEEKQRLCSAMFHVPRNMVFQKSTGTKCHTRWVCT